MCVDLRRVALHLSWQATAYCRGNCLETGTQRSALYERWTSSVHQSTILPWCVCDACCLIGADQRRVRNQTAPMAMTNHPRVARPRPDAAPDNDGCSNDDRDIVVASMADAKQARRLRNRLILANVM